MKWMEVHTYTYTLKRKRGENWVTQFLTCNRKEALRIVNEMSEQYGSGKVLLGRRKSKDIF